MDSELALAVEKLNGQLLKVERRFADVAKTSLAGKNFLELPEISLRGTFVDYLEREQALKIQIGHNAVFYPLSYYDGAWLPMPHQQVQISLTSEELPQRAMSDSNRGIRASIPDDAAPVITAYGRNGRAIPPAPRIKLKVDSYNPAEGVLVGIDAGGYRQELMLSEEFHSLYDSDFAYGQKVAFRRVSIPPRDYFVPISLANVSPVQEEREIYQFIADNF